MTRREIAPDFGSGANVLDRPHRVPSYVLHRLLARVARVKPLLIVTTNYDDLLERAFDDLAVREPGLGPISYEVIATAADLLAYRDTTGEGGSHGLPDDQATASLSGRAAYTIAGSAASQDSATTKCSRRSIQPPFAFDFSKRSVIYKVHGSVPRGPNWDGGYLIAEEDYVRFLGKMDRPDIYPCNQKYHPIEDDAQSGPPSYPVERTVPTRLQHGRLEPAGIDG